MSNHSIDCRICSEDLRGLSGGHMPFCPRQDASLEEKIKFWKKEGLMNTYWVKEQLVS